MSSRVLSDPDLWILDFRQSHLLLSALESNKDIGSVKKIRIHAAGNLITDEMRSESESRLARQAGISVSRSLQEKHYLPRLVLSAFVFLFLYFIFSLAVRDPLPMVDEILLSLAGAAIVWMLMNRSDEKRAMESKLMGDVGAMIRDAEVVEEESLARIEEYVDSLDGQIVLLSDILSHCSDQALPPFEGSIPKELEVQLEYHMAKEDHTLRDYLKLVRRCKSEDRLLSARLLQAVSAEGLNLPLLALLSQID